MSFFPEDKISKLKEILSFPRKIAVTTHLKPDGDALGSSLGLSNWLKNTGHSSVVVSPTAYDPFLSWMKGSKEVIDFSSQPKAAQIALDDAEILFCLDFGGYDRVGDMENLLRSYKGIIVLIDHHMEPEDFADIEFHIVGASSTAELLFWVLDDLGGRDAIDSDIAECIYTGIITDTGSFRFSSTTPDTHRAAAYLQEKGIDAGKIYDFIYNNFSEERTRFLGYVLYQKMKVLPEYHTAYMVITKEENKKFGLQQGDTEGFVNYNLSVKGVNFGVLIKEDEGIVKFSFRSIGSFPCNEFAKHFSGGGHFNASGGRSFENLEETEKRFLNLLEDYKDRLKY